MRDTRFWVIFAILIAVQVLFNVYFTFTPMLVLSVLPMLILLLPEKFGTPVTLCLAFVCGFLTDFLSSGVLGLSSAALLPVALLRNGILRLVFGKEVFSRKEQISMARQGIRRISLAILMTDVLYFIVYVWIDSAGTGSFLFCSLKILLSSAASLLVSIPGAYNFTGNRKR